MSLYCAPETDYAHELFNEFIFEDADEEQLLHLNTLLKEDSDWLINILQQYRLSSKEGLLLMSLAEALLRIPDQSSMLSFFNDRIHRGDWELCTSSNQTTDQSQPPTPSNPSNSPNTPNWLAKTLAWLARHSEHSDHHQSLMDKLGQRGALEVCSFLIEHMSSRFVFSESIESALIRSRTLANFESCSFDMLGEAALTQQEAEDYFSSYCDAIIQVGQYNNCLDDSPHEISIKLSALHSNYTPEKKSALLIELLPKLEELCNLAADHCVSLTFDAEEQYRLDLFMELFDQLINRLQEQPNQPSNTDFKIGIAIQAYGKRAIETIDRLASIAHASRIKIGVRLVKGAYWDYEIKRAQQLGLSDYPVWSEKCLTDANYLRCAEELIKHDAVLMPEFATHNPETLLQLTRIINNVPLKLQRLHGMGALQHEFMAKTFNTSCRVYCPVGKKEKLLPYLVRRLIENGANSSFIYQIYNKNHLSLNNRLSKWLDDSHPNKELAIPRPSIPKPKDILDYKNSSGLDASQQATFEAITASMQQSQRLIGEITKQSNIIYTEDSTSALNQVVKNSKTAFRTIPNLTQRCILLHRWADLMESHQNSLISLLVNEAGKTINDAIDEIREACDFCRFYALQAEKLFATENNRPTITGESNFYGYQGKGTVLCLSPWNFPLAIFIGQISAAWVTGNSVIAKAAKQTPIIAQYAITLAHQAGIDSPQIQLIAHSGTKLLKDLYNNNTNPIDMVCFTGSGDSAKNIQRQLAESTEKIVPLIAETGGLNTMIADSTALIDQLIPDIIDSAFGSAGQRCSALRIAYIQQDIWEEFCTALAGRMATLTVARPDGRSTDVGPVIDARALENLNEHEAWLQKHANLVARCGLEVGTTDKRSYFSPCAYHIEDLDQLLKEPLNREHFGPILHLVKYSSTQLPSVINNINASGYGLTFGLHSRNQDWIDSIVKQVNIGNIYINRTITGAKVGSQPFGGQGLSGTGPKAGGENYLRAFVNERVISTNLTAWGGNSDLL